MCNVMAAAMISVGASIFQGISANQAAKEQARVARMQAERDAVAAENNARIAREEAAETSKQGFKEEDRLRDNIRKVQASQRAAAGASGIKIDEGSPLDLQTDTAEQGEKDILSLRQSYQRKKFGLINEASTYDYDARETRRIGEAQASAYRNAGRRSLYSSLLSSAGTIAGKWDDLSSGFKRKTEPHEFGSTSQDWYR